MIESVYVVAYRSYDCQGNRIHSLQSLVKGPFKTRQEAYDYMEKTCKDNVVSYQTFCKCKMVAFGDDLTLYRTDREPERRIITYTVVELKHSYNPDNKADGSLFECSDKKKNKVCTALLSEIVLED